MTQPKDGGPMHPYPIDTMYSDLPTTKWGAGNWSVRDEFAKAALQGELACQAVGDAGIGYWEVGSYERLAQRCYSIADAMLLARERSNE